MPAALRAAVLVPLLACGPSPAKQSSADPATRAAADSAAATHDEATCNIASGTTELTLTVDGATRTAIVRRGSKAAKQAPVIFVWHGFGSSAERMMQILDPKTRWEDAIVVAPTGLGRTFDQFGDEPRPGWQIASGELEDRDLHLFDALLDKLSACTDPDRVFSTGFSNGGFFSNVLGCHRADKLRAIAPVGGGGPFVKGCGKPMPVLITHGLRDDVVKYDNATKTAATWAEHNGCPAPEASGKTGCVVSTCEAAVEVCTFDGKHTWPRDTAAKVERFFRAQGE